MKCYLMNKNKKVALIEYDTTLSSISKIYETLEFEYAPLLLSSYKNNKSINMTKEMNKWFRNRGIPSWRKDLEKLLQKLNIDSTQELLDKAYGLSLSDQYWINPVDKALNWKDINFFTNDFEYKAFFNASILDSYSNEDISLITPNNSTEGMLQKAWIIEDKERVLIKGTYHITNQEPLNEWLASQICRRMEFNYCNYDIDVVSEKLVSKCKCFINENEEIITANDIIQSKHKDNNTSYYKHYLSILEEHKLLNAQEDFENMLLLDYIVMNYDRHTRNYGIIRNVETLSWERITPIFDTGEAMQNDKPTSQMNFEFGAGKFFDNTNKSFEDYLKIITNINRFDLSKLDGIVEDWEQELLKYKQYTGMESERIEKLVNGLRTRINLVKSYK